MPESKTTKNSSLIRIRGLDFAYGGHEEEKGAFRLRVPRLDVEAGAEVALVGGSGCGKTTLAHLIAGIARPESGSIRIDGVELSGKSDRELRDFRISRIGFVFQEFELLDYLRAEENILLPFLVNGSLALGREEKRRARDLAESVGLGGKLRRRPGRLSQGERQRVAICRALVTRPRLIIADEPTGNLDPHTSGEVMRLLHERANEAGATLLMITHDHALLGEFDRTIDLEKSSIVGDGEERPRETGGAGP